MPKREKKFLGEAMVELGLITPDKLKEAKEEAEKTREPLRRILIRLGMVDEEAILSFIEEQMGIPRMDLSNYLIDPKIIELIPENLAHKYLLIPLFKIGDTLTVAMADPMDVFAIDEIRLKTHCEIEPVVVSEKDISKTIDQYYGAKGSIEEVLRSIDKEKLGLLEGGEIDLKKLEGLIEEAPVVKIVNLIIMNAIKENASDIHLEPDENVLRTRYRIDGVLHEVISPPKSLQAAIISRVKILSGMDIAEKRIPQDGRYQLKLENRQIDCRISTVPTVHGENVVIRLLDLTSVLLGLGELGFSPEILKVYEKLIRKPYGIILVTGPTGSGKTTTLYASLSTINSPEKNIITIEDPIEYRLELIRQMQVNPKAGLTFANGLRSILRQDPDIIMVGEIRDLDTAEIAIQAALTGHLVFSTLHTNDAPGAITRLVDMGVEPFLVSSSVTAVIAQRLVRMICQDCKESYAPEEKILKDMGLPKSTKFFKGKGCKKCLSTGYKGRIAIFELMVPDDGVRALTVAKASSNEIRKAALKSGMKMMRDDGIEKVKDGVTTLEELLRVTQE
ncbi:MAG: type II secretion system protein GspE [Omnitrophica WOR_2 bacterium SM23_29]|nr:MAG: type II secretion system protein GspE [Omnitrophica WOR_2 bacterium SM23_29]